MLQSIGHPFQLLSPMFPPLKELLKRSNFGLLHKIGRASPSSRVLSTDIGGSQREQCLK